MLTLRKLLLIVLVFADFFVWGQQGSLHGKVHIEGEQAILATVKVRKLSLGTVTDKEGKFRLTGIPYGAYEVEASHVGYEPVRKQVTFSPDQTVVELNFDLRELSGDMEEIVVTGTKTFRKKIDIPIVVNILSSQALNNVQACNLSEGLRFQTGLRVETNCQTCNYTQLRMNGLAGGYSQILINGRPIFSPLSGLYGLEQLPVNMIEKIEVVRGGGSSLYGASAIGGTVNVITKMPKKSYYELGYVHYWINGRSNDQMLSGNASLVSKNKKAGIAMFVNHRNRDFYDHNGDNFSEIPLLRNTSFGTNLFFLLGKSENQKLQVSLNNINEYRLGGDMTDKPAYLRQQVEERTHATWMGNIDYQIDINQGKTSLITYLAMQHASRKHYTGTLPDDEQAQHEHFADPPYGSSRIATYNTGIQINHTLSNFLKGKNILTFGSEYVYDKVADNIPAYNYTIGQTTGNVGVFLQSDWTVSPFLTVLAGVRADWHSLVNKVLFNPRASVLYTYKQRLQFRLNYGTGFRAPQAFDADLHIAIADGGVSRISISKDLLPEISNSLSGSVSYFTTFLGVDVDVMLEGFYTRLREAFYLKPMGRDDFGLLFEKTNGKGATVQGATIELGVNHKNKIQMESGFTLQTSRFDDPIQYIEGLEGTRNFARTPNYYGFATLSITPLPKIEVNLNYLYTGRMNVPHFAGAPGQPTDEMYHSKPFSEVGVKLGYTVGFKKTDYKIEMYGGVKNLFNAYQSKFDTGKNRDSNFVFGPAQPRTFYVGIKLKSG